MLGTWRPHAEYRTYLRCELNRVKAENPRVIADYATTIIKMWLLDLDPMKPIVAPLFSTTGRPSHLQPEMMRLLVLMGDRREHNPERWLKTVAASPILCALVGLPPDKLPGVSTLADFVSRLWAAEKPNHIKPNAAKPKEKYGKEKQPPKRPGIIAELCRKAKSGEVFGDVPEIVLQNIFMKIALEPSKLLGLLDNPDKLYISADGSCAESHAAPNGHKACNCKSRCDCDRRYADPDATWGWDSYHERYFYGYHIYALSTHNKKLNLDLPVYLRFADASQFDGVTLVEALSHARSLYQNFINFDSLIADSAHDNLATYDLCRHFKIKPFIDLHTRSAGEPKPQNIALSRNGHPVCPDGHEMYHQGFDRSKFRTKYRCPLIMGKVTACPYNANCNKSLYGKIVYIRHADDLRFSTPVPRGSTAWTEVYNQRTAAERLNNRILTDYKLEQPKRYGKRNLAFAAFVCAINIHLDAMAKHGVVSIDALLC